MIEIIREESWDSTQEKKGLPKNIKQIGTPDIGDRIYIENKTYQYLHPYHCLTEKLAYVLLGRFEDYGGRKCTFVEAAIFLEKMEFDGGLPVWNDDTWAYLYRELNHEYDDMVIVGWALDIKGQLPNLTAPLEKLHRTYFGGTRQILYLMDSLEGEEYFYGLKNGYLHRREGYYIYFDQTIPTRLNEAMDSLRREEAETEKRSQYQDTEPERKREQITGQRENLPENENHQEGYRNVSYREYLREQAGKKEARPAYASTILLAAVVIALGLAAFQNYRKMNAMEETLAQMNTAKAVVETETTEDTEHYGIKVENINGSVTPESEENGQLTDDADEVAQNGEAVQPTETGEILTGEVTAESGNDGQSIESQNTETAETQTEETAAAAGQTSGTAEQSYLAQGYYIVQEGDSLVGICKKVYQTTAMMDKLCEVNGIENPDAIYAGQYLTLPN